MKKLYYELIEKNNEYFCNGIKIKSGTFYNKFTESNGYKQEYYTCYFDPKQNFIRKWVMSEKV